MNYQVATLSAFHNAAHFDSGEMSINVWLQSSARFSQTENMAQTFVIADNDHRVIGYYALCSAAIHRNDLAKPFKKHGFPSMIPLVLLARLGVDRAYQGKGIGSKLLADAFSRCLAVSKQVAMHGVLVHTLNDAVKSYYASYGFIELPNIPQSMILPMNLIARVWTY